VTHPVHYSRCSTVTCMFLSKRRYCCIRFAQVTKDMMHTQVFSSSQRIEGDLRDQGFLPPLPASVPAASAQPSPPAASSPSATSTTNSEGASSPPAAAADPALRAPSAPPAVSSAAEDVSRPWMPLLMVRYELSAVRIPNPTSLHARHNVMHACQVLPASMRQSNMVALMCNWTLAELPTDSTAGTQAACAVCLALTTQSLQTVLQGLLPSRHAPTPSVQALNDLAEVADAGGCTSIEVVLDRRQHGTQSLLLPGLAAMQGAALCIRMPGLCAASTSDSRCYPTGWS